MLKLDGKVAFVSGAGSEGDGWGNGKATAVLLARQGARVFGTCEMCGCDITLAAEVLDGGLSATGMG